MSPNTLINALLHVPAPLPDVAQQWLASAVGEDEQSVLAARADLTNTARGMLHVDETMTVRTIADYLCSDDEVAGYATDPRVAVRCAVAGRGRLPAATYAATMTRPNGEVASELLRNPSCPTDVAFAALDATLAFCDPDAIRDAGDVLALHPDHHDRIASCLLARDDVTGVAWYVGLLPGLSQEVFAQLVDDTVEYLTTSGYDAHGASALNALTRSVHMTDPLLHELGQQLDRADVRVDARLNDLIWQLTDGSFATNQRPQMLADEQAWWKDRVRAGERRDQLASAYQPMPADVDELADLTLALIVDDKQARTDPGLPTDAGESALEALTRALLTHRQLTVEHIHQLHRTFACPGFLDHISQPTLATALEVATDPRVLAAITVAFDRDSIGIVSWHVDDLATYTRALLDSWVALEPGRVLPRTVRDLLHAHGLLDQAPISTLQPVDVAALVRPQLTTVEGWQLFASLVEEAGDATVCELLDTVAMLLDRANPERSVA